CPFYIFRPRGFDAGHPFFASMDEMVSCYTAAVKKTQATGPYAIAGHSYGGIRLEVMGDEVEFVGLINIPPDIAPGMKKD
ncbi:Alpha/Beta hydrolase protein, partial [Suillus spraguei]